MTDEYSIDGAQIEAARTMLSALEALVSSLVAADEEGLIEHAEPMCIARMAIVQAKAAGIKRRGE
ncbi:MAG: hypothetical protein K0R61_14 [Microvirga sp.]|jgi:hypothetical protein|nr:hypothetical protein [Microvirga sp.]MDF2969564.1 hypothetical protein [Microvirga sp.]